MVSTFISIDLSANLLPTIIGSYSHIDDLDAFFSHHLEAED